MRSSPGGKSSMIRKSPNQISHCTVQYYSLFRGSQVVSESRQCSAKMYIIRRTEYTIADFEILELEKRTGYALQDDERYY